MSDFLVAVPEMVISAKSLSLDPTNPKLVDDWRKANNKVSQSTLSLLRRVLCRRWRLTEYIYTCSCCFKVLDVIGEMRSVVAPSIVAVEADKLGSDLSAVSVSNYGKSSPVIFRLYTQTYYSSATSYSGDIQVILELYLHVLLKTTSYSGGIQVILELYTRILLKTTSYSGGIQVIPRLYLSNTKPVIG